METVITVKKRDGRTEEFNINKIRGYLKYGAEGLDINIDNLLEELMDSVQDGMTTEHIQKTLITLIALKIDIDKPHNKLLAGRLYNADLRHKVTKVLGGLNFKKYINYGIESGKFDPVLKTFDIDELAKHIDHSKDDMFTYFAATTFEERYIKKDGDNPFEVPQYVFMAVSMILMQNEEDKNNKAIAYYNILSDHLIMNSTPTLSNARTVRCQLNSCYGGVTHDSAEGILHSRSVMALLSKFGGGIGWSDNLIRSSNSSVDNVIGASCGLVPLAVHTNAIQLEFDQLGCVSKSSEIHILRSVTYDGVEYDYTKRKGYINQRSAIFELIESIASELLDTDDKDYNEKLIALEEYITAPVFNNIVEIPEFLNNYVEGKYIPKEFVPVITPNYIKYNYFINEYALVIDSFTLQVVPSTPSNDGKLINIDIGGDTFKLSSIMAYTFLDYKGGLVYHIDNNTHNCNLSNLTIVENMERVHMKNYKTIVSKVNKSSILVGSNTNKKLDAVVIEPLMYEDITVGSYVMSYDEIKGVPVFKEVLAKHTVRVEKSNQIRIKTEIGEYTTSAWHPTPKISGDAFIYVRADSLKEGDITISNNGNVKVIEICNGDEDEEFIDFTIKDTNNYFVSVGEGDMLLTHNTRKGAIASYIEPWHMDVYDFIDLHKPTGDVRRRAYDMNIAIWENKLFIERVKKDQEWTLFDPYEVPELSRVYGEEFRKLYEDYERSTHINKKKVNARDLYDKLMIMAYESGQPYMVDKDEANRRHMNKHLGQIMSSNLCVTGDTRLATQFGLMKAEDLYRGKKKLIATVDKRTFDKGEYGITTAECIETHKTKENADVYELKTSDGYTIKSTDWHEYYVKRDGKIIKIKMSDINKDTDKLLIQSGKGQFTDVGTFEEGATIGKSLSDYTIPESVFCGSEEFVNGFIAGLKINELVEFKDIGFSCGNVNFIRDLQILLVNLGIPTTLTVNASGISILTETKDYLPEKDCFETTIESIEYVGKEDVYDTTQLVNHSLIFNGIVTGNCTEILQYAKEGNLISYIYGDDGKLIGKELGDEESEYGIKFSKLKPSYKYNEQDIAYVENKIENDEIFVCTLASINLSKVNTEEDIKRVVPLAIRALDNIIDINYYPVSGAYRHAKKTRAIGLGVMGEHHLLVKEKLKFGSKEAHKRMDQIMEWVSYYAIKASAELAEEKGKAPGFEGSEWEKGILPIDFINPNVRKLVDDRPFSMDWDSLREKTKKGMRNLYLLAVAPTTNISVITDTTPSVEPIYKRVHSEETSVGTFRVVVPDLNVDTYQYYESAYDIDQKRVIENLAVIQQWLDQATSGNLFANIDRYKTTRDIGEFYHYARHLGVISIYYLRGKSPEEITSDEKDDLIVCSGCQ